VAASRGRAARKARQRTGREGEFKRGIDKALSYAATLHCPRVHVMAGLAPTDADRAAFHATYRSNLAWHDPYRRRRSP
jgi:hydroxypyruvate isomerase